MSTQPTPTPASGAARPVILVADDYADDIERVTHYLPKHYEVATATTYDEACTVLTTRHVVLAIVDLFLDNTNMVPYGIKLLQDFKHVPFMMMSGKDGGDTDRALQTYNDGRLKLLSKDRDLDNRAQVEQQVTGHLDHSYNNEITFELQNNLSWDNLAARLLISDGAQLGNAGYEIQMLARAAFKNWDQTRSPHIRAETVRVLNLIHSGDNSIVMHLSILSATKQPQSEVVLKITKKPRDKSAFAEVRNVLGGFGLHELSFARTCNFDAQIYAVPYFKYAQTTTYRSMFESSPDDEASLDRIGAITHHLFSEALGHLADRAHTSRGERNLADYYLERINAQKRVAAVTRDLTADTLPGSARLAADGGIIVRIGTRKLELPHPLAPVLIDKAYRGRGMLMNTALRHGDLHGGNVLVDVDRRQAWFIDYEDFGTEHFSLADHVEMEASLLFAAMGISADLPFWAQFTEAITPSTSLTDLQDVCDAANSQTDRREARKALAAIRAIRRAATRDETADNPALYYHALMYEALRAAGARSKDLTRRWHALITAAQLLERLT